eukprot:Hpha_TRINITY_DN24806_c0_g1::TRINITY_DN24806_c0_g1_i1::g.97259::m.97259
MPTGEPMWMSDGSGTGGALTSSRRVEPLAAALRRRGLRVRLELDPTPTTWGEPRHGAVEVLADDGTVLVFRPHAQHEGADIRSVQAAMLELANDVAAALPREHRGGYYSPRRH